MGLIWLTGRSLSTTGLDLIILLLLQLSNTFDNTQGLLATLFDQLSQAEPISFYVDVLKDQSSDNISLLNDLNNRESVISSLLTRAHMIESAGSEQNTVFEGKNYSFLFCVYFKLVQ